VKRKQTTAIVIHHSASRPSTTVAEIKLWHTDPEPWGRGWDDIGYHWIITEDGALHAGRPEDEWGTQVAHFNDRSLGICLTGNFDKDYPTGPQINALISLLIRLVKKYGLQYWNIYGHKDIKRFFIFNTTATNCPGNHLYALLPDIRRRVMTAIASEKVVPA